MSGKLSVRLENRLDEIQRVDTAIEEFTEQLDLSFSDVFQIRLVVEELFTNIVSYAYDDDEIHEILITIACNAEQVEVTLEDDGKPFNPLEVNHLKGMDKPLEEVQIGGKGWTLVRAYMQEIEYELRDGKNHLTLVKHLSNSP